MLQEELGLTNTFTEFYGNILGWRYDDSDPITIYVTNSKISTDGNGVHGLCYGNNIYLSTPNDFPSFLKKPYMEMVVIHELSHSFGLDYCNYSKCAMHGFFDEKGELTFC